MTRNHHHTLFRIIVLSVAATILAVQASAWSYQVSVVGNTVNVIVTGLTGNQCCGGASFDLPIGGGNCSIPCGTGQQTATLTCNSVGTHALYVWAADQTTPFLGEYKQTTVDITVPPPPTCPQFDLITPGINVLTHSYGSALLGSAGNYPPGQTTDGEYPVSVRTRAAPAGTVIYLKVIDPEDSSAYGAPHQTNDNIDTSAGTIGGSKTTSVTLPQAGAVNLVLKTTLYAAGDNYKVLASADPRLLTDPNFVCDPNAGCRETAVITARKRWYIEMNEMYRNSQLLAGRVLVGDSVVFVNDRGFRRGDNVRLVHAPSYLRNEPQDVDGFYSEDRTIVDVGRATGNQPGAYAITLNMPLQMPYFTDILIGNTQLGDALVDLSRNAQHSSDPVYHFNRQYAAPAFAEAFVELVPSPTSGIILPLYDGMTDTNMVFVGGKWFAARESTTVPDNFGFAVSAATRAPLAATNALSLGTTTNGAAYSYVWRQNIDEATSGPRSRFPQTAGLNADTVSGEVLVHELGHQWNVNAGYLDHECTQNSYANASLFCQGNSPNNAGQYGDGIIHFHYVGNTPSTADSEYMTIRKTVEPKP